MFAKVLVANRGEIAARIIRTLRRMGIHSVAVTSEADRFTPPVLAADESVLLGGSAPADSYLRIEAIVAACRATGAEAVHPGYGFLSERPAFAEALSAAGVRFIGPTPAQLRAFGLKHTARALAAAHDVPLLPGTDLLADADAARRGAARIGYPVMLKSTAGGGGIGMRLCRSAAALGEAFATVTRQGEASFGDPRLYLERCIEAARHVEVQIFGDGRDVLVLGERDCSLQRRNQKVIEETPAPGISDATRAALHAAAARLGRAIGYESAGTVEFILDARTEEFFFLEVNTRLQVEHGVTEAVTGIDLVEWMIRQAAGGFVLPAAPVARGAAVEARIYAESAATGFRPSIGRLTEVSFPPGARVDTWVETGTEVTPYYDPLLAKIIVTGADRAQAWDNLLDALRQTRLGGIDSNIDDLAAIACDPEIRAGPVGTGFLARTEIAARSLDVLSPGTQSSIQELPGRLGWWDVGVPPSGPMDDRSFRLANRIVGNAESAPALEMTLDGPTLRFHADAVIALAGAAMDAALDGEAAEMFRPVPVRAGQVLTIGTAKGPGQRAYLAVRHGFDVPSVLGSRATFALGGFGGHATGCLRTGDVLRIRRDGAVQDPAAAPGAAIPLTHDWTLEALYGPHGAPDFFDPADIADLFSAEYQVHYNSARTGVRLVGPTPRWARADGGEAGLHPSNIHDNAYAVGAVDFTGDMPILLGPDGPSLGGFVCPAVVTEGDRWKLGQLRPGDRVRFVSPKTRRPMVSAVVDDDPVLLRLELSEPVVVRRQGESSLLVEFGAPVLDIGLRLRAQILLDALRAEGGHGIIDLTPGIRSLQVHYDPAALPQARVLDRLENLLRAAPEPDSIEVESRVVHLPLSWDDAQARLAATRYMEVVRPNAPWCPSNLEFIRRINGLDSIADVAAIVFDADYLVLGLGDVYLGAPVATPVDPRHRLVTTKYNPARTWTPENAVGIGGAYLCVYGMEGPGGYQLVGRTVQMWNTWRRTPAFERPHLLRFFDRIRFHRVDAAELAEARAAFPHGRYDVRIEPGMFDLAAHRAMERREAAGIAAARRRQQDAFARERQDWIDRGLESFAEPEAAPAAVAERPPQGWVSVEAQVPGNLWKVLSQPGDCVQAGETLAIIESMKMEMRVVAPRAGVLREVTVRSGREVRAGQRLFLIDASGPQ